MEDFERIGSYLLQGGSTLMWIAIGIGVLFVAIMAYDFIRRRRSENRYNDRVSLLTVLKGPFRRAAELRAAIKELRRQRAERRKWEDPGRRVRRPRKIRS